MNLFFDETGMVFRKNSFKLPDGLFGAVTSEVFIRYLISSGFMT